MITPFDRNEIGREDRKDLTAEEEVYDWMKSTPVSARKRPEWLAEGEHWTPPPAMERVSHPGQANQKQWMKIAGVSGTVAAGAAAAWYILG